MLGKVGCAAGLAERSVDGADYRIEVVEPDSSRKKIAFGVPANFIPRHVLLGLLAEQAAATPGLQLLLGVSGLCIAREPAGEAGEEGLLVTARAADGGRIALRPRLLAGADGLGSAVRAACREWAAEDGQPDRFQMVEFPSPAGGLRYKVLSLPPALPLGRPGNGPVAEAEPAVGYVFAGRSASPTRRLRIGLLPVADASSPRTGNLIARPSHALWAARSAQDLWALLEENFPQLSVREVLPQPECEAIAAADGGVFPQPQAASAASLVLRGGRCGVALLGDALHSFPPDVGQGVNSALQDAEALAAALTTAEAPGSQPGPPPSLAGALTEYERARLPEAHALARLVQFAHPYQYTQDQLRKNAWTCVFVWRALLARAVPWAFKPHVFARIFPEPQLSYQELLKDEEMSARRAVLVAIGLAAAAAWAFAAALRWAVAAFAS